MHSDPTVAPLSVGHVVGTPVAYPDQQLSQDHVALAAGQVQRCAAVPFPAGFIHLIPGPMCQEQDDSPQVFLCSGTQQLLAQGELRAWQWG